MLSMILMGKMALRQMSQHKSIDKAFPWSGGGHSENFPDKGLLSILSGVIMLASFDLVTTVEAGDLIFSSNRSGNWDIYRMNVDTRETQNLSAHPADDTTPSCSTNGKQVAFCSNRDGYSAIYVMESDGGKLKRVVNDKLYNERAVWSPDDNELLVVLRRQDVGDIFRVNIEGQASINLTNHPDDDDFPVWSPCGKWIAFFRRSKANRASTADGLIWPGKVLLFSSDDTDATQIIGDVMLLKADFVWAPSGNEIAFSRHMGDLNGGYDIFVANRNDSNLRRLTTLPGDEFLPSWSPDGKQLAFLEGNDAQLALCVLQCPNGPIKRLTKPEFPSLLDPNAPGRRRKINPLNVPTVFSRPVWSHDGKKIAFVADEGTAWNIYWVDVATGSVENLTNSEGQNMDPAWLAR